LPLSRCIERRVLIKAENAQPSTPSCSGGLSALIKHRYRKSVDRLCIQHHPQLDGESRPTSDALQKAAGHRRNTQCAATSGQCVSVRRRIVGCVRIRDITRCCDRRCVCNRTASRCADRPCGFVRDLRCRRHVHRIVDIS